MSFEKYSDILLDAYQSITRADDVATKKKEILDELFQYYDTEINSVLFVGFSPGILKIADRKIYLTQASAEVQAFLDQCGIQYTYLDWEDVKKHEFSVVVAVDEYFTFADSDNQQRELVNQLAALTRGFIITTLKDYKNQDYREREFSFPVCLRSENNKKIYFEQYDFDVNDRNVSFGTNYIVDDESVMLVGPFARRAMYFKQLAKFSLDAGAQNFLVHKNLMHKSIIKKNYEHIITIKF